MKLPRCKGRHLILVADEYNAMGAVVTCVCGETIQISDQTLNEHYYHTTYVPGQANQPDRDIFIAEELLDEVI